MRLPWQPAEQTAERTTEQPGTSSAAGSAPATTAKKRPLYVRLLGLRHIHPNGWQRAALGEGALALAVVLVLADVASAWTLLALPLGVAVLVKAHDVLAGWLGGHRPAADAAPVVTAQPPPQHDADDYPDLAVLEALRGRGADLSRPREATYYLYAPDEPVARALANVAAGRGFATEVREPAEDDDGSWSVVCETTAVFDADAVRANADFFDDLAQRYDAEYDGWEATV